MATCNLAPFKYLLGKEPNIGGDFIFSNNLAYDSHNREIFVGPANSVTGAIINTTCTISLENSITRIKISTEINANREKEYFFEFAGATSPNSNLIIELKHRGRPEFTILFHEAYDLAFIGTEDIRTGRAVLPLPVEGNDLGAEVYVQYDSSKDALLIKVEPAPVE